MTHDADLELFALVASTMRVSQRHRALRADEEEERRDAVYLCGVAEGVLEYLSSRDDMKVMPLDDFCRGLGAKMLRRLAGCMAHGLGWAEFDATLNADGSSLQDLFGRHYVYGKAWLAQLDSKLKPLDGLCDRLDVILEQRPDVPPPAQI